MKRLLTLVLAAMAFVACTQNEVEELTANRADVPETLTVGFEGGDTRIELNEALKTVWTEGDEVSVFYKTLTNIRGAFQGKTGDRQGNILLSQTEFGDAVMDEYVVIYPYNEYYLLNAETLTLNAPIPATQSYKEGSYGENGNIMADASDATHVTLRSIYGWLRVHLTGDGEVVESITLRGNNGEQLAGYAQIDLNDYSVRFVSESSEPENDMEVGGDLVFEDELITEITLDCGEGVELGSEAKEFYIALPPQTFAEGLTIEVNCAGYNPMTLSTESSITIERNHIKPMAAVEYEADSEPTTTANQLWYTATALVEPNASAFNVAIVSNEWNETTGEGVITFDGELTTIGEAAFDGCRSLTSVTIPDSITSIGDGVFEGCYSLTSVTIGDSVTSIGDWAFYECTSLTSVTIPDSVTTIGKGAFRSCYSLTSVTIGDSVTTIGDGVFAVCSNLAEFKGKFAADGGRCLIKDNTLIAYAEASGTTYTIPDSVTTIGNEAFEYCGSLTSVTIPDSVTTIGEDAFDGCRSLTSVTIPDSVTTIGDWAFEDCDSLTSVTIGNSVTSIGDYAFAYCDDLTSVYCKAPTPPTLGFYVFDDNASGRKIYAYEECVDIYKAAWSEYADSIVAGGNIPESVTTTILYTTSDGAVIDASKFPVKSHTYNNGVGELIVYGELKAIPNSAFYEFGTLTTITIPDNVTTIGSMAFYDCDSLTSVTVSDSVTTIGYAAFENCDNLTSVTIGDSVTTIGERAFYWCYRLTNVTIPDRVTTIGDEAFYYCSSLTSVTIPDSVTTIGGGAFASCHSLAEFKGKFVADGGRCLIKDNTIIAYANASGTTYTIPDSVTTIGASAFDRCSSLTSVTIPDSVTTIGNRAFGGCTSLTSVTIPDSVMTIGGWAFSDCISLTSVYCKATTPPSLGDDVFKYWDESAQEVVNIGCAIYAPAESVEAYKAAEGWSEYAADIVGYNFEMGEEVAISNKLFYTATALVEPHDASAFNVAIVSNEWDETTGKGVITFDGELTTIGDDAFSGCDSLTSVTIGDSVTTIGDYAFCYCISLTSVTIPDNVTTIGEYAFYNCTSLTSVTIGDSVTTIGSSAFYKCDSLTSVTIGDSVTTIGIRAFENCSSLTSVTIPDSVTTIGDHAFYNCTSLTSVTIGNSVTTIGDSAFRDCSSLTSVYCEATTPPTLGYYVFKYLDNGYVNIGCPIYVPAESVGAYKAAENWSEHAADIVGYDFE